MRDVNNKEGRNNYRSLTKEFERATDEAKEDFFRASVTRSCYFKKYDIMKWAGSSVGMATDYGLDGPGSNPGGDEIFRPSRPAHPASCKMGTGSFPGGKVRSVRAANRSPPSSAAVMEE